MVALAGNGGLSQAGVTPPPDRPGLGFLAGLRGEMFKALNGLSMREHYKQLIAYMILVEKQVNEHWMFIIHVV